MLMNSESFDPANAVCEEGEVDWSWLKFESEFSSKEIVFNLFLFDFELIAIGSVILIETKKKKTDIIFIKVWCLILIFKKFSQIVGIMAIPMNWLSELLMRRRKRLIIQWIGREPKHSCAEQKTTLKTCFCYFFFWFSI